MTPSQIVSALRSLLAIRQPAFLWGPPGVGKSQVVAQVARQNGLALRDIRAVLLDPVDLRGLPRISADGRSVWCPPAFLPGPADPERGIVFLDELNAAPPLVQAACYQLVLDRAIGEYRLPDGWSIVAAGNREGDRAVAYRMPSALANRMVHLDFTPDLEDWLGSGGGHPSGSLRVFALPSAVAARLRPCARGAGLCLAPLLGICFAHFGRRPRTGCGGGIA